MRIKRIKEKADIFTSAFSNNTQSSERTQKKCMVSFFIMFFIIQVFSMKYNNIVV